MIPFNKPVVLGSELKCLAEVFEKNKFSGDGFFSSKCQDLITSFLGAKKTLLTTSCTDALEMAAILLDISPGDEVIMPSFTFVSTANAFVLRGARIVFLDINPTTMNMDENLIEEAITSKTRAIVLVHYAGWSCDLDKVLDICRRHNLPLVEDAAQALGAQYKGKKLGTFGDLACFSFHETKNIQCGEGGALVINNDKFISRSEIIREKGTNRSQFLRGQTDKYTWVDLGSSFLPSELNASFLSSQLESITKINNNRFKSWNYYKENLSGVIEILDCPDYCTNNAHLFGVKATNIEERTNLIDALKEKKILSVFHYVPLHSSPAGKIFSTFHGVDKHTTRESERLLRLPLYFNMSDQDLEMVTKAIKDYFQK